MLTKLAPRPYTRKDAKEKAYSECWCQWHVYNCLKLAAALASDISTERDAKASAAWHKRDTKALTAINDKLMQYASTKLTYKSGQRAVELIHGKKG